MTIKVLEANTEKATALLKRVAAQFTPDKIDGVVAKVTADTLRHVVEATPKRFFGDLRRQWRADRLGSGSYVIRNSSKVMLFLEEGTANGGTGRIYPKTKKALYIPLTRRAALGWKPGLKYGVDYILRKSVRGIKPRWIVRQERIIARQRLLDAAKAHIEKAIKP